VDTQTALAIYRHCRNAGLKNGVVQDKLWLPGLLKLRRLIENDFLGRILSVRVEFGYWVFEGHSIPAQRPSWNYRKEDQGGILLDMMPHFRYILDNLFGTVKAVSCTARTHIPERIDENGTPFACTAEDAGYATFELTQGIVAHINFSWTTRVRRDDLVVFQVDGTRGSAVAGLRECYIQHYGTTPRPVWNPDVEQDLSYFEQWARVPAQEDYDNAFKAEWELFLRHVVVEEPFQWDLLEGAKGVQLAELAAQSWRERRWVDVPELDPN
jgi:predicted dehydrogenase